MGFWSGGRLWSAVRVGLPAGVIFGGLEFADGRHSVDSAIVSGILFAVFFSALMTGRIWRSWPGAKDLTSADRTAAARVVRRGESVGDPGLAPAVIEYAAVVTEARKKERRNWWVLLIFLAGTLVFAVSSTVDGSTRSTVVWWVLVGFWVVMLALIPRRSKRVIEHAERADEAARNLTDDRVAQSTADIHDHLG
jgi:hypothetical protein